MYHATNSAIFFASMIRINTFDALYCGIRIGTGEGEQTSQIKAFYSSDLFSLANCIYIQKKLWNHWRSSSLTKKFTTTKANKNYADKYHKRACVCVCLVPSSLGKKSQLTFNKQNKTMQTSSYEHLFLMKLCLSLCASVCIFIDEVAIAMQNARIRMYTSNIQM